MRHYCLLVLVGLLVASTARAQRVEILSPPIEPQHPRPAEDNVHARVRVFACSAERLPIAVQHDGSAVELRYAGSHCLTFPVAYDEIVDIGLYPLGAFVLRAVDISDPADPQTEDATFFNVSEETCAVCLLGGRFQVQADWSTPRLPGVVVAASSSAT